MKKLLFATFLFVIGTTGFGQVSTCNELPIANPDVRATAEGADAHFNANMPASIGNDENTHGVFKVLVDCEGEVGTVVYTNGEMSDAQADDIIEVIKTLGFTAGKKDGEFKKTYAYISLKITSGTATCGIN